MPIQRFCSKIYLPVLLLFVASGCLQVFFAGAAALIDASFWSAHLHWVAIFQWLCVLQPVLAWFASRDALFRVLNIAPIALLSLQYWLAGYGLEQSSYVAFGLHAVCGVLLLCLLVFTIQEWRYRARARSDALG